MELTARCADSSCRASGSERNRIGVVQLSMGNVHSSSSTAECYMVLYGTSKSGRLQHCDARAQVAECVASAALQHVGRTASMMGSTRQRKTAAPFTARPAFRDYGSCGPYGGVHAACERAPEAVLATSYGWWQRGSTPRWGFHGLPPVHGVGRCVATARPRTQRSSLPATPRSRADEYPPRPSQVARRALHSPPTAAAGWPEAEGLLPRLLPPPSASPPPADAPRARCACAAHVLMCHVCACI